MIAERRILVGSAACAIGLVGMLVIVCVFGGAAWRAWLAAAVLCAAIPAGCAGLLAMVELIPGPWREALRPALEQGMRLWPLGLMAMAPVLVAPGLVYGWVARPEGGAFREVYLSPPFFLVRGLAWFGLLVVMAKGLDAKGLDAKGLDGRRAGAAAIVGLLVYTPFSTLIATDWLASLDPKFSSSGFGLYVLGLQMAFVLALAVGMTASRISSDRTRDALGAVLFASVCLWAYLGFMPYFITWSGNLPAGVAWYRSREGGWAVLIGLAIVLKLGPAAALALGSVRRNVRSLTAAAACIAIGAVPEMAWLSLPAPGVRADATDLALFGAAVVLMAGTARGLLRLRGLGSAA
jgi:hypothetical protein